MTRRRIPPPEPPENREEPGRPSAPPRARPGLPDATEALPENAVEQRADGERLGNPDYDGYDWIKGRRSKQ